MLDLVTKLAWFIKLFSTNASICAKVMVKSLSVHVRVSEVVVCVSEWDRNQKPLIQCMFSRTDRLAPEIWSQWLDKQTILGRDGQISLNFRYSSETGTLANVFSPDPNEKKELRNHTFYFRLKCSIEPCVEWDSQELSVERVTFAICLSQFTSRGQHHQNSFFLCNPRFIV